MSKGFTRVVKFNSQEKTNKQTIKQKKIVTRATKLEITAGLKVGSMSRAPLNLCTRHAYCS